MTATFARAKLELIGAKKKEKGKEAMLGVKEKKMREQELEVRPQHRHPPP